MALLEPRMELSDNIKQLKNDMQVTYKQLNALLGTPCSTSTLQRRAAYPKMKCTQKLHDTILASINAYRKGDKENIDAIRLNRKVGDCTVKELIDILQDLFVKK